MTKSTQPECHNVHFEANLHFDGYQIRFKEIGIKVATFLTLYFVARFAFSQAVTLVGTGEAAQFNLIAWGSFIVHTVMFYGLAIPLYYLDVARGPRSLYQFKTQRAVKVHAPEHWYIFMVSASNQVFLLLPTLILAVPYFRWFGMSCSEELPQMSTVLRDLVGIVLLEECGFYYGHRLLHLPQFYKVIHKKHHEYRAPVAQACEYAHPVEFLMGNIFPVMIGPLLLGVHVSTMWLWISIAIGATINGHCGYEFPWTPFSKNKFHDYHHEAYNVNYGSIGLLDWFHNTGTTSKWR